MAITIDVITKVVDSSLKGSSDTIDKHFTKSGKEAGEKFAKALADGTAKSPELQKALDKAADATGRLRVEQEKLNAVNEKATATNAQKIAQSERLEKAKREEARAVRDAANAYERANTTASGTMSILADLSAGTRFGGLVSQVDSLSSRFGGIGLAAGAAIGGVAALGVAAVQVGRSLYDLGKQWDDVGDSITARTGKVGAELQVIVDQVAQASWKTAASTAELGNIGGQVAQSLRTPVGQIGDMTQKIAELNNLTGEQTNIRQLGEVYRMFGVEADKQVGVLNGLYDVFTQTGIPVNELIATIQKSGPTLAEFGMNIEQAAGFVTLFEKAGVPADSALKGLKFALKKLAEAGVEPREGLRQIVTEIQNLIEAGDNIGARSLAEERFGKGFPEILRAIRENRIELDALPDSVDTITDHIGDATDATKDFEQEWQIFKNQFEDVLRPAATGFFNFLNQQLSNSLNNTVRFVADMKIAWEGLFVDNWWEGSAFWKALEKLGLVESTKVFGGAGDFGTASSGNTTPNSRLNDSEGGGVSSQASVVAGANAVLEQFGDQIRGNIGGSRAYNSAPGTHEVGLAMDIPIGPDQMALGDQINAWLQANADKLNIKYTIWRDQGRYAGNPNPSFNSPGHFNHIDVQYNDGNAGSVSSGAGDAATAGVLGGAAIGGGSNQMPPMPTPVGPGTVPPANRAPAPSAATAPATGAAPSSGTFTPGNFPAAGDVAAANPNLTPVQMVPSPFGPTYQPVPAGSTPGYNQTGKPGYYLPDPSQIANQTKSYEQSVERVTEANQAIEEAKNAQAEAAQKAAEVEQDLYSTAEDRKRAQDALKRANDGVARAVKAAQNANESAEDAEQRLAEAKRGTFREAQKAAAESRKNQAGSLGEIGAPLADDLGLSEGLPGIAKWLTTFLANLAMAPVFGALAGIGQALAPGGLQGGHGLMGYMGMTTGFGGGGGGGVGGSSLYGGLGYGTGMGGMASIYPSAMGPAPLGGGLGLNLTDPGMPALPSMSFPSGPGAPTSGGGPGGGGPGAIRGLKPQGFSPGLGASSAGGPITGVSAQQGPGKTAQMSRQPWNGPGGPGFGVGGGLIGLAESLPGTAISGALGAAGGAADAAGGFGGGTAAAGAGSAAIAAALDIGWQEINRAIGQVGQVASIAVGGAMETFLPHDSELADPSKSWFGRVFAGLAGARPSLPNKAGDEQNSDGSKPPDQPTNPAGPSAAPQSPEEAAKQAQAQNAGQGNGPMVNVENLNNYAPDGGQAVANQIGRMQMSSYASGGPR